MDPVSDFFTNPKRKIGGAVIPLLGPPGSGKTNALIQLALMRLEEGHKVIWRGIKQAEWVNFLANDVDVTVWYHKSFDSIRFKRSTSDGVEYIDFEEVDGVEKREWSDASTVVEDSDNDCVNVVYVPGIEDRTFDSRKFFTRNMIDILDAIVNRQNSYKFVDFFTDEAGDIWPGQQQVKGDLWQMVGIETPPLLAQLRKQNSFLYLAAHGKQDIHHFVYKVKANSIGYMQFANVVKEVHPTVDKKKVNNLDRGEVIVPPYYDESFVLASEEESLDWVGDAEIDMDWKYQLDLEDETDSEDGDGRKKNNLSRAKAAKKVWDSTDMTQTEAAEIFNVTQSTISSID